MATRIVFQLFFFLLPFALFGLYRLAVAEAQEEGRKPWPIRVLFGIGLILGVGSWLALIFLDRGGQNECFTPARIVDGKVIPGEAYPCEKDLSKVGVARSDDPGGTASGVTGAEPDPEE